MAKIKTTSSKELWQTSYNWMRLSGNKINKEFCRHELLSHPEYPSLISVVDLIESGGMDYKAVRANKTHINNFNYPVLAHIKGATGEYLQVVQDVNNWTKIPNILSEWSGVVLFPGKNTCWQNEQNEKYKQRDKINRLAWQGLLLIGLIALYISTFSIRTWSLIILGCMYFIGLVLSIATLAVELGLKSEFTKRICGVGQKDGCDKVLSSRYASSVPGFTMADLSFLYFSIQFACYLLGALSPNLFAVMVPLTYLGVPVAIWSLYTQYFLLKEWCPLCLSIVGVLVIQSCVSFFASTTSFSITTALTYLLTGFSLSFLFVLAKQVLTEMQRNELSAKELKKWKLDADLFLSLWRREPTTDTTIWDNDILLGDREAPLRFTIACDTYCRPCAQTHVQLDNLLNRLAGKISVQLRFMCIPENLEDSHTMAVLALLSKAATSAGQSYLQEFISDWFKLMDLEKWEAIWHPAPTQDAIQRLWQHRNWVKNSDIKFTPTIYINGRKLPGRYTLNDLETLLPQLIQSLPEVK